MKKVFKRIVCLMLVIATISYSVLNNSADASTGFQGSKKTEFISTKDNQSYECTIEVSNDKKSFILTMKNLKTGVITENIYNNGILSTYEHKSKKILGHTFDSKRKIRETNFEKSLRRSEKMFSAQSFGSQTICIIPTLAGNNLWYRIGNSSPDYGYMQMGCVETYRVATNACSECATFRNKILEANASFAKCGVSITAAGAIIAAILLAGVTGGLSLAGAFGFEVSSYYYIVDACFC